MAEKSKVNMLGTLSMTSLEKSVGRTIVGKYSKSMESYLVANLSAPEGNPNYYIPDIIEISRNIAPKLESDLIKQYNADFALDDIEDIPDDIKILQASLIDGLMFAYNMETGDIALYTCNLNVLFGLGVTKEDYLSKCVDKNKVGGLFSFRVDIEYTDETKFTFKATRLNKNTEINAYNFALFPYIFIAKSFGMFKKFFDMGAVLKVQQILGGMVKERYLTTVPKVLAKYCDNKDAVNGVEPAYFPLKAFFYAPVIGATSLTSMVSKVNLFSLDRIDRIQDYSGIKVKKVKNPIRDMIGKNEIYRCLDQMYKGGDWDYNDILEKLPRTEEIFTEKAVTIEDSAVSPKIISKYLNSLTEKELEEVYEIIPGVNEGIKNKQTLLSSYKELDVSDLTNDSLRDLLKKHILSIIIRKKDCTLSSMIVTNNPNYLRYLYGDDYFGKYEGFNVRFNALVEELSLGKPLDDALKSNGFANNPEVVAKVKELESASKGSSGDASFKDELQRVLAESSNHKVRKSSNTDNILARKCFAEMLEEGSSEFYRWVDISKIQKIAIVSE